MTRFWFCFGAAFAGALVVFLSIMPSCAPVSDGTDELLLMRLTARQRARTLIEHDAEIVPPDESAESPKVEPPPWERWLPVTAWVTGYCPCARCCGDHADGRTATGVRADFWRGSAWGIAADLDTLSPGTLVAVPGYVPTQDAQEGDPWPVDDTGGRMRKAAARGVLHLDARFIHHRSARRFGSGWRSVLVDTDGLTAEQVERLRAMDRAAAESDYHGE